MWHHLVLHQTASKIIRDFGELAEGSPSAVPSTLGSDILDEAQQQLHAVAERFSGQMSLLNKLQLLVLQMRVQSLWFLYDEATTPRRDAGILCAYQTSLDIMSCLLSDDGSYKLLPCAPSILSSIIFHACVVVLRVVHSTVGRAPLVLDYNLARSQFNAAVFVLRHMSTRQHTDQDRPSRAADMLQRFWRAVEATPRRPLVLHVKTRMGVSIVYDSLYRLRNREHLGSQILGPNKPAVLGLSQSGTRDNADANESQTTGLEAGGALVLDNIFHFTPSDDLSDFLMLDDTSYSTFLG